MESSPEISVVLAVRNDPSGLETAARSILAQQGVDLELVIVDDGSSDATGGRLERLRAEDSRVRPLSLGRTGLTGALIEGCAAARAPLIARQDAGDYSDPDRLCRQLALLRGIPEVTFVSCWTLCLGPEGEELQTVTCGRKSEAPVVLVPGPGLAREAEGPSSHGSVVFRRSAYAAAGGYRRPFGLAQDWDLWWRLAENGAFASVPATLYTRTLLPSSLTFRRGEAQRRLGRLAAAAAWARHRGEPEEPILRAAAAISASLSDRGASRRSEARALYFIGSLLRARKDSRARRYFQRAIRQNPLLLRAWVRWAQTWV